MQAGVAGISNRTNTTINGGRPTWTQVTLDGINIQDNFIRTNSLDFLPNRPNSDNVAEFAITTSVSGADSAGGATSVRMVTPSGTNTFRGSVFEFNRDSKFAANSFFNNAATEVPKPELSRHQFGGRLGGPILKNKLFFFANYEGFRQTTADGAEPDRAGQRRLLNGVFRYVGTRRRGAVGERHAVDGAARRPEAAGRLPVEDPGADAQQLRRGQLPAARSLNTAGYRYNQSDLNNRDQYTFRLDYTMTRQEPIRGRVQLLQGDRRPDRPRCGHDRSAAGVHLV